MAYRKWVKNNLRWLSFDPPTQHSDMEPIGSVPIEFELKKLSEKDDNFYAICNEWCCVFTEEEYKSFKKQIDAAFNADNWGGHLKVILGMQYSKWAMEAYKKLVEISNLTDYKFTTTIMVKEKGNTIFKNVPLNAKTLSLICKDNLWDSYTAQRKIAEKSYINGHSHQDRKIASFVPKGKLDQEKDEDETYLYFSVPGCSSIKILGSVSLLAYFKNIFPNWHYEEVSIGPSKIISSHSQGREKERHSKELTNTKNTEKKGS